MSFVLLTKIRELKISFGDVVHARPSLKDFNFRHLTLVKRKGSDIEIKRVA